MSSSNNQLNSFICQPTKTATPAMISKANRETIDPVSPQSLEDLDSINFALGLHRFDIAAHQPHPPGYPAFIAIAPHLMIDGLNRYHDRPCLLLGDNVITYAEMRALVSQLIQRTPVLASGFRLRTAGRNRFHQR